MKDEISTNSIIQNMHGDNPLFHITEKEFNEMLLKFGSMVSIIKNKRINQTMLMIELLESSEYRSIFKTLSGIDRDEVLIYNVLIMFPILSKSKIIKNKIAEMNNVKQKRKRVL